MNQHDLADDRGSGRGDGASGATIGENPGHVGSHEAGTDDTSPDVTHAMTPGKERQKGQDEGSRSPR